MYPGVFMTAALPHRSRGHLSSIPVHMLPSFPIPNTCRRGFHVSKVLRPILKINYVREHSKCFPIILKIGSYPIIHDLPVVVDRLLCDQDLNTFILLRMLPNHSDFMEVQGIRRFYWLVCSLER